MKSKRLFVILIVLAVTMCTAFASTVTVSTWAQLKAAIENSSVDKIIVNANINVDCTASGTAAVTTTSSCTDATSAMHIARSLEIEGKKVSGSYPIIKRTGSGVVKSLFEIYGNGSYDGITVSFKNITLDGGAVWGSSTPAQRSAAGATNTNNTKNSGVAGRAIIDIANKATVNLENNCIIQNGDTCTNAQTNSTSTAYISGGSYRYAGGVRVEFSVDGFGGGTINVKSGSTIQNCNAQTGGAIGAYNFARLNVYGGNILNCSGVVAAGGIVSTRRAGTGDNTNSQINMYGGLIKNCYAPKGGALNFDVGSNYHYLLGGTITGCNGAGKGSINFGTSNSTNANSSLANGNNFYYSDYITIEGSKLFNGSTINSNVVRSTPTTFIKSNTCVISFKNYDGTDFSTLFVEKGKSLGAIFPADITRDDDALFMGWYSSNNVRNTKDTTYSANTTVTAMFHIHNYVYYKDFHSLHAYCAGTENSSLCPFYGKDNNFTVTLITNFQEQSAIIGPNIASHKDLEWYSEDPSIVTVDSSGTLRAKKSGFTFVYVKNIDGTNISNKVKVTVK